MRFRRLALTGFKSFVEPAELRIEPGLTGVVGPNGCGKSNLLEALRWVMGEGSAKSVRGSGMDDVIFAGTATRPPRDFAEVSLLIGEDGQGEDAGERQVTRRIERGAGSSYRIDGRDVRQKDVALLFADAATGAHSPALVSQGRIGAVISARPAERRQMLEEAAGIAGLHVRRKDAETKLRATEANLQRLDEILGEQDVRAGALKRQARAAERYRGLTDRIRRGEGRLIYSRWAEAERAARAAGREADEARGEVDRLTLDMERAQGAQAEATALLAERRQAALQAREEGQEGAHRLATARAALDTARRRLAELDRARMQLETERSREVALEEDAGRAIAALAAEGEAIAARLAGAGETQERLIRALDAAERQGREAEAALGDLLTRDAASAAERRIATAALDAARGAMARIDGEQRKLTATLNDLGDERDLIARADAASRDAEAAHAQATEAETAIASAERERAEAAGTRDQAQEALAHGRATHAAAASEADALRQSLAAAHPGDKNEEPGALENLKVEPGFESALAAALGDDLGAPVLGEDALHREAGRPGGSYWSVSMATDSDPALGPGLAPLIDRVRAPPELARRLRQIGVVARDEGQALAVGQRLVTLDGRMRRWDGFVSSGSGGATAERLRRANRLAMLDEHMPAVADALGRAEVEHKAASARLATVGAGAEKARARLAAAENCGRVAEREADAAAAALERHRQERAALEVRLAELDPVRAAAVDAVGEAERVVAALPTSTDLADALIRAREIATAQGRAVADRRAELATAALDATRDCERQLAAAREQAGWEERGQAARRHLADHDKRAAGIAAEQAMLAGDPQRLASEVGALEAQANGSGAATAEALAAEREAERAVAEAGAALSAVAEHVAGARETRAAAAARAEAQVARRIEYGRVAGERFECPPPLLPAKLGFDPDDLAESAAESASLERLTAERERLGPVNLVAEEELVALEAQHSTGAAEREELGLAIQRLRGSIGNLNREGRARLLIAFEDVDRHFRSLFTTLFDGGQAHLALIDSDDPLEAGLEIMAQPPGKRLSALSLLSGGEQALTAVALIFALFLTKPSPICVLDEVDAPLDDANVERFCDLLARMSADTDTRYLIVTHNAVTMSRMHRLYGVTMIEKGISRIVSVNLGHAERPLAAE